jgi:Glycosyl transferase family 2
MFHPRRIALALEYHLLKKDRALLRRVITREQQARLRRYARAAYLRWDARQYNAWMAMHIEQRRKRYAAAAAPSTSSGLLSIVTAVWDGTPLAYFRALAGTIIRQNTHGHTEWVVLNNGCQKRELLAYLGELKRHPWITVHEAGENLGIIGGLRLGLESATGRYILPVDADDWLYPDCLETVSWWTRETGFPPLLYSDEDKLIGSHAVQPYLKPDFDPVLLLNSAYIAHLGVIDRRMALDLAAGYPPVHIPEVIYSWRMHPESTAADALSKPYIHSSQKAVLERYLDLKGIAEDYSVEYSPLLNGTADWWIRRKHVRPWPAVCVVLTSEVFMSNPGTAKLAQTPDYPDLTFATLPARANTRALQEIADQQPGTADWLVCLASGDLRIDRPDWLWDVLSLLEKHPDTVMVGGRILTSQGAIVSAGSVLGFDGSVGCPDRGRPAIDPGYFTQIMKQRSVSAVSSQFAVIRASFLRELPGDVSIPSLGSWAGAVALRQGKRIVYSPFLSAVSSIDWDALISPAERESFQNANRDILPDQRYYSRYLGLNKESAYRPVAEVPAV